MEANDFLFGIWLTMMAVVLTYLVFVQVLWRYLRRNCQATWDTLGKPSFWNNSPKVGWVFVGWLVRRDYCKIGDARGIQIAKATAAMFWLASVVVFVTFAVAILTRGGKSWPL